MKRPSWWILPALALISACPTGEDPEDDDAGDDDGGDDDSTVSDDDSTEEPACSTIPGPFTLQFGGGVTGAHTFDLTLCEPYGGDVWRLNYDDGAGWILRIVTGPLANGQTTSTGNSVSLISNAESLAFNGRADQGHVSAVTTEIYVGDVSPCGTWTTDPIPGATTDAASLTPQPIPFVCP